MQINNLIISFDYLEQRDIFAILVNLFSLDTKYQHENDALFYNIFKLTQIDESDIKKLVIQKDDIKLSYELIILKNISIQGQKYLNVILENIYQTTKSNIYKEKIEYLISHFAYDNTVKEKIKEYVKNRNDNNLFSDKSFEKELLSPSLKLLHKNKTLYDKIKIKVANTLAFSSNDGNYGIKELSLGSTDTIHIFINGFINDTKENNFKLWMENTKYKLNQDDIFLGYDWASGKDPTSHILSLPNIDDVINKPFRLLKYVRGLNPLVIGATVFTQTIAEWKQAKYNSKLYSEDLAKFINTTFKKNNNMKINLYGHSLGANLIHNALEYIEDGVTVNNIYLFGGAALNCERSWTHSLSVTNNIFNFYSSNDYVLKIMYQLVETGDEPIGLNKINIINIPQIRMGNIQNYDVSHIINGHTEYINKIDELFQYCSLLKNQILA